MSYSTQAGVLVCIIPRFNCFCYQSTIGPVRLPIPIIMPKQRVSFGRNERFMNIISKASTSRPVTHDSTYSGVSVYIILKQY